MILTNRLRDQLRELNGMLGRRGFTVEESLDDGRTVWSLPHYPDMCVRIHEYDDAPLTLEALLNLRPVHTQPFDEHVDLDELAGVLDRLGLRES